MQIVYEKKWCRRVKKKTKKKVWKLNKWIVQNKIKW